VSGSTTFRGLRGGVATWLLAAFALCPPGAALAANLLVNGSFESGPAVTTSMALPTGSTSLPGWVVTRAGIRYVGSDWTAAEGLRSVALNGANAGGIAQTFATIPHAQYTLRLYMAGDPETLPNLKTMAATAAGVRADFSMDITGMWAWDPGWDLRTFSFNAVSTSTTVELFSTMAGTTGPTVDSVSVELTSLAGVDPGSIAGIELAPPAPNPSRGGTTLAFSLPVPARARVAVQDVAGREVAVLADGDYAPGPHRVAWDGTAFGRPLPPGLYLVSLRTPGATRSRRLLVLR
jgi:choice-of-anchor C domain-containing protein